jgi:hypothetical protein
MNTTDTSAHAQYASLSLNNKQAKNRPDITPVISGLEALGRYASATDDTTRSTTLKRIAEEA